MKMSTRNESGATVVSVKGKVDTVTAPEFGKYLNEQISKNQNSLIVNMAELYYMTSAGLREILGAGKELKDKGHEILLAGLQDNIRDVFQISGFASLFKIFDTEKSALEQV